MSVVSQEIEPALAEASAKAEVMFMALERGTQAGVEAHQASALLHLVIGLQADLESAQRHHRASLDAERSAA